MSAEQHVFDQCRICLQTAIDAIHQILTQKVAGARTKVEVTVGRRMGVPLYHGFWVPSMAERQATHTSEVRAALWGTPARLLCADTRQVKPDIVLCGVCASVRVCPCAVHKSASLHLFVRVCRPVCICVADAGVSV